MTVRALIVACALLPVAPAPAAEGGEFRVHARTGLACDRSSGEPLYRELHEERWEDGRLVAVNVHYDAATRALLRYEGTSNLRGADGGNLDVTIEFSRDRSAQWNCPG